MRNVGCPTEEINKELTFIISTNFKKLHVNETSLCILTNAKMRSIIGFAFISHSLSYKTRDLFYYDILAFDICTLNLFLWMKLSQKEFD